MLGVIDDSISTSAGIYCWQLVPIAPGELGIAVKRRWAICDAFSRRADDFRRAYAARHCARARRDALFIMATLTEN